MLLSIICTILLVSFIPESSSIRCMYCYSEESLNKCLSNQRSVDCGKDEQCFNSTYTVLETSFYQKGCVELDKCNSYKLCGTVQADCKYSCCKTENCNSATTSSITMVTVLFIAFIPIMLQRINY